MAEKKLNLLADFPSVSAQQWMDKITADLKGADFNKKLVWKTNEGFNVLPFYRAEDIEGLQTKDAAPGVFPFVRGTKANNEWFVRQDIVVESAKEANAKALEVLCKGATSLCFILKKEDLSPAYIATLLENIQAECVELNFRICVNAAAQLATILTDNFKAKGYDVKKLQGSIGFDPINRMLQAGKELTKEEIVAKAKGLIEAAAGLPFYRVIAVNATTLNNAGAFVAQELGYALAWGNEYLSSLVEAGVDTSLAAKKIKFNFGVGGNYFMEIAKFRAARLLWAKIVDAYQPECRVADCKSTVNGICKCAAKMRIHAETSIFNKTIFDANVNMLRTQTEAMSATLGGVNSLTVLPYDVTFKASDEFSERIARNQQLLLKEESHFDKVVDPAAGSYYIETLTNEIAAQAWKLFLEVEDNGGFYAAVTSGSIQQAVKATAAGRLKSVSSRREVLLGTNQFPNFSEVAAAKVQIETVEDCGCTKGTEKLLPVRGASEFEALRFATEKAAKRPKAFMLTIGSLAMRLARAQFSCNFFACAGYEVVDNLGFATVEEGVAAAQAAGADIIVLCSSDDEYAELAPAAFKVINGKQLFVVAGAPACTEDLKAIGIEYFVNVKTNVLETLKTFNSKLGIN
ncbi:heterodimeric methylmalonyl-CoA mutase small subunit [Paludibacter propionicigenes WB4]|uniref:Methylmalonyl-CoA mutase small subunit n=1 Tax=Paludibacter propionicigenes (strain DSM 17365 / JCM 13257 / WB4) TaxID=694427 RepID=E4T385_PALPW|nr:methylmalonyl-CoA mutase small subunit [Paludibacter propionicigenes]ADQ79179.1 heterodimeric methylmalonyl-CoA mutase small subunit [Paludibacter propionicigenes WB4]